MLLAAWLLPAALCIAWLNPTRDRIDTANRLFKQGKYTDALSTYGEVLVDNPDSPLLNFNMGDANYKAGKYSEALASYGRVRVGDGDPKRIAKTAYNAGNAQYRLGAAAEADKPQDALKAYALALAAYRRALGADPTEQDAKFNYEFVAKKIEDLKKKLAEQQKQQDQQKQPDQQNQKDQEDQKDQKDQKDQQGQQDKQDQQQPQDKDQQQQEKQEQAQQDKPQQPEEQEQAAPSDEEKQKEQAQQQEAGGGSGAPGEKKDKMSQQEAAALLDSAKNDELQPEDFARQVKGAGVAEPAQDW